VDCRAALEAIDAMLDGELEAAERRELEAHLGACASCRGEVDGRRAFSDQLRRQLSEASDDLAPAPGEKERCLDRMVQASRRRYAFATRIAAVLVIGVSAGVVAYALGLFGRPNYEDAAATLSREGALTDAVAQRKQAVAASYNEIDRLIPKNGGNEPFARVASLFLADAAGQVFEVEPLRLDEKGDPRQQVAVLVEALKSSDPSRRAAALPALKMIGPGHVLYLRGATRELDGIEYHLAKSACEAAGVFEVPKTRACIDISQSDGTRTVRVRQYPNATVVVEIDGRRVVASDMTALIRQHPDVCRDFSISGTDGKVTVGSATSTSAFVVGRGIEVRRAFTIVVEDKAPEKADQIVQEAESRRRAVPSPNDRERAMAEARAQVDRALEQVRSMTGRDLERRRAEGEERCRQLERQLEELETLQKRLDEIRVYVETLKGLEK
jgi:hypothetical protein